MIDAERYPRCAEYVARLPEGLASYPECLAKTDLFDGIGKTFPELAEDEALPEPMRRILNAQVDDDWFPEVVGVAVNQAVRDRCLETDEAFDSWLDGLNAEIFRRPLYRALIMLLSPQLLIMGAAKRWGAMHRGTELTAEKSVQRGDRRLVHGTLTYPERLFDRFAVRMYARAFVVAAKAAHAQDAILEIESIGPTVSRFSFSWEA